MKSIIEAAHLNPFPKIGERRVRHGVARGKKAATAIARVALIRLSFSQRDSFP